MRTLVIECATDACSAAVFDGASLVAGACETIGRGHAERLVPMIAELPGKGRADRIAVSLGPGSFTGVRIGLAAARALALAWGCSLSGYPTLALVAAMARRNSADPVTVCMTGGHGQWFVQDFGADDLPECEVRSLAPEEAAKSAHALVAGSQAEALVALRRQGTGLQLLPDARAWARLPAEFATLPVSPIYGRTPDARPPSAPVPT